MSAPSLPNILAALQAAPPEPLLTANSAGRTFQELTLPELTLPLESEDAAVTNKYDLLCPRGCRSVILKRGVGKLVEQSGIKMDPPNGHSLDPALASLPAPPATVHWWLVTPSAMKFENVGFSRPVARASDATLGSAAQKQIKYLICADCDVGPLGWSEQGGDEFWLACARVNYAIPSQ